MNASYANTIRIVKWRCSECHRFGEDTRTNLETMTGITGELAAIRSHESLSPECKAYIHMWAEKGE